MTCSKNDNVKLEQRQKAAGQGKTQTNLQLSVVVLAFPLQKVDLLQQLALVKFELPHSDLGCLLQALSCAGAL